MNSNRGTLAIIANDFKLYLLIFWGITILQGLIMLAIGMFVTPASEGFGIAFGSLYGGIVAFSCIIYANSYRPAISLGTTRPQYLKIFSLMAALFTVLSILMLNALYYLIALLEKQGMSSVFFFHPGMLFSEYQFGVYLWIDLMVGFSLMGITMVITSAIFRYGVLKIAVLAMILAIVLTIALVFGHLGEWLYILFTEKILATVNILGLIGIILVFVNFLFMRHAPLTYNTRNG